MTERSAEIDVAEVLSSHAESGVWLSPDEQRALASMARRQQERIEAVKRYADRCAIMRAEPSTEGLRRALSTSPGSAT